MKTTGTIIFTFFFVFGLMHLYALDPGKPLDRYIIDEWKNESGFRVNDILHISQSPDGYLWIAADRGLYRFDGLVFDTLPTGKKYIHPVERYIYGFDINKKGEVWFGDSEGLKHYSNGRIYKFPLPPKPIWEPITHILEDSYGNVWVATRTLNLLEKGKIIKVPDSSGVAGIEIVRMFEDSKGILWIGSDNSRVFYGQNKKFSPLHIDIPHFPKPYSINAITEDREGSLWLGTSNGLVRIKNPLTADPKMDFFTTAKGLSGNFINAVLEDSAGNLWVGADNGVNRGQKNRNGELTFDHALKGVFIQCFFEDRDKNIWIGTWNNRLFRMRTGPINMLYTREGLPEWGSLLFKDRQGRIWLSGLLDNHIYQYKNGAFSRYKQLLDSEPYPVKVFAQDKYGDLWMGTTQNGLMHLQGNTVTKYSTHDGLPSDYVRALFFDRRERLWIGTYGGGLAVYADGVFKTLTTADGISSNGIYHIDEDKNGNIWLGTMQGVTVIEKGDLEHPKIDTCLLHHRTFDIHQDPDDKTGGTSWIGTFNTGFIRFKNKKPFVFNIDNGMPTNCIYQVYEDERKNFWLSSADGILKINKTELDNFANGKTKSYNCILFDTADGMLSEQCMISSRHSIMKTQSGDLWFATIKGIAVLRPHDMKFKKTPPQVVIESAAFNGEVFPPGRKADNLKGIKIARFRFNVPVFVSPEKVKIRYRLEGFETRWRDIEPLQPRKAKYTNLPPGKYRFRVIAANSDGIWNKEGAVYDFSLGLYFYQTLLFKIVFVLFMAALIPVSYIGLKKHWYMRKLKNKYKNSTLDPLKAEQTLKKVRYLVEEKKFYKQDDLTLETLSVKLKTPRRYITQVVNEQLQMNFREWINTLRIRDAKKMLTSPEPSQKQLSILEIAFEVGYNSKEVFNRAFKKHTGKTPTQYKKDHSP